MKSKPLNVLLVEDNPGDATLFRAMLQDQSGYFVEENVDRLSLALEKLAKGGVDVVLLDLSLPDSHGPQTFIKMRNAFPAIPIILLTGLNDVEMGVLAMREGVQDYLVKGQVDTALLSRSIRYAIERKRSELLLIETEKTLTTAAKLAALGTMAGGIAHELNSPLTAISFMATEVKDELKRENSRRDYIEQLLGDINETVRTIGTITHGLRIFAQDAQMDPLVSAKLRTIVDDTFAVCAYRFKEYNIAFEEKIPNDLCLDCRKVQISQILLNLFNNSFEAVKGLPERWIQTAAKDDVNYIELSVTDSGTGIPKDILDKLFDPFFTTKHLGEGVGLGLSISKGLVASHKGEIFVDEKSDHTKFVVRLPKSPSMNLR